MPRVTSRSCSSARIRHRASCHRRRRSSASTTTNTISRQQQVTIEPGTILVAATDGITEARSPSGAFFGMDGTIATLEKNVALPVSEQLAHLGAAETFADGHFQDDIAALAVRIR